MRATVVTLLATLSLTAASAFARNGETGILIFIKKFEIKVDEANHSTIIICNEDWQEIYHHLDQGQDAQIFLKDMGTYAVEVEDNGDLLIHMIESSNESVSLLARDCSADMPEDEC